MWKQHTVGHQFLTGTQRCLLNKFLLELASRSRAHSGTSHWLLLNTQYLWSQWRAYIYTCQHSLSVGIRLDT